MRLYFKLLALIALFIIASRGVRSEHFTEAVFLVRTAYVCSFGGSSEFETLVDDAQRQLARESGQLQLYYAGRRAKEMFTERQAAAARLGICLTEEELDCMAQACFREAVALVAVPRCPYDEGDRVQAASGR